MSDVRVHAYNGLTHRQGLWVNFYLESERHWWFHLIYPIAEKAAGPRLTLALLYIKAFLEKGSQHSHLLSNFSFFILKSSAFRH